MNRTMDTLNEMIRKDIIKRTDAIWKCAHRYLWHKYNFTEIEVNRAKNHIKKYFEDILPELYFRFSEQKVQEFAYRVLMACDYVKRKSDRYIPHPVIWFNPNNPHGFVGTKLWFDQEMENAQYENIRFYHQHGVLLVKKVA